MTFTQIKTSDNNKPEIRETRLKSYMAYNDSIKYKK